jgi:hypothetical protein
MNINDKHYDSQIKPLYEICLVAKSLMDEKVSHLSFTILTTLLAYKHCLQEAIEITYFLRDLSLEMMDFGKAMQIYEHLGCLYSKNKEYPNALIAYKKMLQLAWLNGTPGHELAAYSGISSQYYYMQELEKA